MVLGLITRGVAKRAFCTKTLNYYDALGKESTSLFSLFFLFSQGSTKTPQETKFAGLTESSFSKRTPIVTLGMSQKKLNSKLLPKHLPFYLIPKSELNMISAYWSDQKDQLFIVPWSGTGQRATRVRTINTATPKKRLFWVGYSPLFRMMALFLDELDALFANLSRQRSNPQKNSKVLDMFENGF